VIVAHAADARAERGVRDLAAALAARGCGGVVVLQGEPVAGAARLDEEPRVVRLRRADLAPEHWQKSLSGAAAELVRALLRDVRPDVLHVHGWRGLSRDLVAVAAQEGLPAVVTLRDAWIGCLVGDRQRRDTREPCSAPLGPAPCLSCAALEPPRTPWVPLDAQFLQLAERRRDLERELRLARAVRATSAGLLASLRAALGAGLDGIEAAVLDDRDVDAHLDLYAAAARLGPPAVAPAGAAWWAGRMQAEAEAAWDAACRRASAERPA
jgi:hypothetical protein